MLLLMHWVSIALAESLYSGLQADEMPSVEAVVDRDANRITIKTKSVSGIWLYLNDALVDLDKEFTVVLNGTAITETRQRNRYDMTEWLFGRWDPSFIWTSHYKFAVPKVPSSSGNGSK